MTKALAYLRTSSTSNVDGDSAHRQRDAVWRFAKANRIEIVGEFYDAAVSGADPIEIRPGFAAMLERVEESGVRLILVEDTSRFARSVIAAELGLLVLKQRAVRVHTASGEDLTDTDDPARVMMRQVAAAFAEYEKARLVSKLRLSRDRASSAIGARIEGRKGYSDTRPDLLREARRLARRNPRTGKSRSLRQIAAELATLGYSSAKGNVFSAGQVKRLLGR